MDKLKNKSFDNDDFIETAIYRFIKNHQTLFWKKRIRWDSV